MGSHLDPWNFSSTVILLPLPRRLCYSCVCFVFVITEIRNE